MAQEKQEAEMSFKGPIHNQKELDGLINLLFDGLEFPIYFNGISKGKITKKD